ncbi:uncharacterized protein LOC122814817 [Protopterus annectens]|uniref:uncharacterized protein LOC122814817 n=1 Tax=Protopterus annectens TaxID=7888 RepID=UPI001CFB6FFC|nr:uncharacterized protein LOC122814817 [Protopterus annectens]
MKSAMQDQVVHVHLAKNFLVLLLCLHVVLLQAKGCLITHCKDHTFSTHEECLFGILQFHVSNNSGCKPVADCKSSTCEDCLAKILQNAALNNSYCELGSGTSNCLKCISKIIKSNGIKEHCCKTEMYSTATHICCGEKIIEKSTQVCCPDLSVHWTSNGKSCCCKDEQNNCITYDSKYFDCISGDITLKIPAIIQHHKWLLDEIVRLLSEVVVLLKRRK